MPAACRLQPPAMRSVLREHRQSVLSALHSEVPSSSCSRRSDWSYAHLSLGFFICNKEHVKLACIDRCVPEGSVWIDRSYVEITLGEGDFYVVFTEGVVDCEVEITERGEALDEIINVGQYAEIQG